VRELLGIVVGLGFGCCLSLIRPRPRLAVLILAVGAVALGAAVSWVNGEGGRWWPLFASFDAAMVWAGALLAVAASSLYRVKAS
jgi:hypothetical protein